MCGENDSRRRLYGCENLRRADISIDNLAIKHVLQCGDAISTVIYSFCPFTRVSEGKETALTMEIIQSCAVDVDDACGR